MRLGKWMGLLATAAIILTAASAAEEAKCGSTGANFESWKESFSAEARDNGIKPIEEGGGPNATLVTSRETDGIDHNQIMALIRKIRTGS